MELDLERTATGVIITITNYGKPPETPLVIPKIAPREGKAGWGLYIIGKMVDSVATTALNHGSPGLALTMVKRLGGTLVH